MIIDCISDLHGEKPQLDGGDLLIVAGDLTATHTEKQFGDFAMWMYEQSYKYKVVIGGNHDTQLLKMSALDIAIWETAGHFKYLCDSGVHIEGFKVWGSPWTLAFQGMNPNCTAFVKEYDSELEEKWALIPEDTDILITHSPPYGQLDVVLRNYGANQGSDSLRKRVCGRNGVFPKLHVFGHIHEQGGKSIEYGSSRGPYESIKFVNASYLDENYLVREHQSVRIFL